LYDSRPPAVEYGLTDMGRSLIDPIAALAAWAVENESRIRAAQSAYDGP
jgi:DNA-binding HxlR family transcriptional regulator